MDHTPHNAIVSFIWSIADDLCKEVSIHLYGQEVNPETYAICKADLLIKGEEEENIAFGSALFTGDAGQGESNIRQWILENDWLEAIIGLPENLFYNTGIATYIWVLTNRKPKNRRGKVQLIDATQWFTKLRKNLGQKNCRFSDEQIDQIIRTFLDFKETEQSRIFDDADFGYWQITVERPLRLRVEFSAEVMKPFRAACKEADDEPFAKLTDRVAKKLGPGPHPDFNQVWAAVQVEADAAALKLNAKRGRLFREQLCRRDETAEPVRKIVNRKSTIENPFEADPELRDHENVPLKENIDEYFKREVLPHVPDAWIDREKTIKGYEISFTKYFYKYQPLRELDAIAADLLAIEKETEGLLHRILDPGKPK